MCVGKLGTVDHAEGKATWRKNDQNDRKFKVILSCVVSLRPACYLKLFKTKLLNSECVGASD